jgi:hypothetical protein
MEDECDDTLVKLDTNVMVTRTALGHGTARDMTIVTICKCVRRVRLIVECSPFFDPEDFIFSAINTTKIMMAARAAIDINAVDSPLVPHFLHSPVSLTGTNPEIQLEQRRLVFDVFLCPILCAQDSMLLTVALSVPLTMNCPSNFEFGAPKHAPGYAHFVKLKCKLGQRAHPKSARTPVVLTCPLHDAPIGHSMHVHAVWNGEVLLRYWSSSQKIQVPVNR